MDESHSENAAAGGSTPDVNAIRGVFAALERELEAEGEGGALAAEFRRDPLAVIASRGIDLGPLQHDAELRQTLADRLRGTTIAAMPAPGSTPAGALTVGDSIGCWVCVKAVETAISIGAGAALALMFAGGAIAVAAIATVSAVVAAIMGISLAAAQAIVEAILASVADPGAFVERLAYQACQEPCR